MSDNIDYNLENVPDGFEDQAIRTQLESIEKSVEIIRQEVGYMMAKLKAQGD